MSSVTNAVSASDPGLSIQPAAQSAAPTQVAETDIENAANLRLVIEEDQISKTYIYKTIDRRTGEIVQQFPREQLVKMRDAEDYNAGQVVSARV